ncbi:hypothetical protein [Nocardia terpenica]|uniref:Uncharacterized protein n=1 Tax=Nocardia terpenica TaxID=455432 RepID=A0A291RD89_9NOCA|nr:hypothetical protein [Nocardia terpenica]ATL65297.1 hypothetical protein CRH09_02715 [Nocardia terpenica]
MNPAVAAAGDEGRNPNGLDNPEFVVTIPAGDRTVGALVLYGSDALLGRALARSVADRAARRAADRIVDDDCACTEIGLQLRNRAEAARRLPGGDPWPESARESDSAPTAMQLSAWAAASADLSGAGYPPIIPASIARLLWSRGGDGRALMERVHRAGGVIQ